MKRRVPLLLVAALLIGADPPKDSPLAKELDRFKVPPKLIPEKAKALFLLRAQGIQLYQSVEKDGKPQWVLEAPQAVLRDYDTGTKVGTHSKGPVWKAREGSKVQGKLLASAPAPNASAIPWLLLELKGDGGAGRFGKVTFIARVDTWAGRAPGLAYPCQDPHRD
jgi:hypothetical protein